MTPKRYPPEDRFWSKVSGAAPDGCWLWAAGQDGKGYGQFYNGTKTVGAHRWAYEYLIAEIPPGLHLDHLCRTTLCVNPWHLDPVPHAVNVQRGARSLLTHCPQGHPYSPENTYRAARGDRQCRKCMAQRNRDRLALRRKTSSQPNPTRMEIP